MKNLIFLLAGLCFLNQLPAQIGIGQWETFQTYTNGTAVSLAGTTAFCGTKEGLFSFDYVTNEVEKYTKPGGYAGIGVTALGYSSKLNATIIAYDDANLDIIKPGEIVNLPQIKNYSISGDKKIYNITMAGDSAILSCGFGVVIVDMRLEIIKTDVKFSDDIGFAGEVCYDATIMNNYYYFATSQGVYKVPYNSNIKDLSFWQLMPGLPAGTYNTIAAHNGNLYFNYSNYLTSLTDNSDTVFVSDGTSSSIFQPGWNPRIMDIASNSNNLGILAVDHAKIYDINGTFAYDILPGCFDRSEKMDFDNGGGVWVAFTGSGMISYQGGNCAVHYIDGPFSKNVWDMQIVKGDMWVAGGGISLTYVNSYLTTQMYYRRNNDWKWLNIPNFGYWTSHTDIVTLAVDPDDAGHVFSGSWGTGLYQMQNYIATNQYVHPFLDSTTLISSLTFRVGGMAFDEDKNLWFSNSNSDSALRVRRTNGTFTSYPLAGATVGSNVGKVAVDDHNQVWVSVDGKGIAVVELSSNGIPTQQRLLTSTFNSGDLPNLNVRAIEVDNDGQVWVGTHDGIRIFSPSQVFPTTNTINGQKIVIKDEDGVNELLLKETIINDIETDGANRKWIATQGTGVRLVSSDGREIIHSFTAENSPLLSNVVRCIAIDDESGEVCFGTDVGIICFRSDATAATNSFGHVYAYPNPVKPEYEGPIAITGMANNSIVKITDIAGNIVYETTSEGGQAIWNGKKYDGKRPSTGVYLVYCANEDASETVVTKILFIH